ncbi:MAG: FtsX-like permease family protein [Oscillospiraceae bacterium]|jgi:hypothetical protein|nr:FtsX-like permease family protein [Oscillospiraceae bacterium]
MKAAIQNYLKYPTRTIIYMVLLIISFSVILLLINTYLVSVDILAYINNATGTINLEPDDEPDPRTNLFIISRFIHISSPSLIPSATLLILLCTIILPFVQYLFSISRGTEMGILRALGMSKIRAFIKLFSENVLIIAASFVIANIFALFLHKYFSMTLLLPSGDEELDLSAAIAEINNLFAYKIDAVLVTLYFALAITTISAILCNALMLKNAPLRLLREYKA